MKTIEEKAKAYDEALDRAKVYWETDNDNTLDIKARGTMEHLFPELTEDEDEKIKKRIIQVIKIREKEMNEEWSDEIAWIEKQGSNLVENGYTDNKDVIKYANKYSHEIWHKLMDNFKNIKDYHIGCNDVSDIVLNAIIDAYNWLEKQNGQKEYTFKSIPRLLDMIEPSNKAKTYCQKLIDTLAKEGYNTDAKIVEEVLKGWNGEDVPMAVMDEQKPADKVEPKFKVGNWVISTLPGIKYPHLITDIRNGYYIFGEDDDHAYIASNDNILKLWTIQDAKDGDVLVDKYGNIGIYQGDKNAVTWNSRCYCGANKGFYDEGSHEFPCHPATKEQRDLILQKMHEAGYNFDFEKKELKKIVLI